ncbi:hypothetical protein BJ166DRAFT_541625 [Pestalotiopsis sp. NC0098]|nr:hypothetical protein BJ166DRAFT_541625 [Pestalotiopsis sp. NC0098]
MNYHLFSAKCNYNYVYLARPPAPRYMLFTQSSATKLSLARTLAFTHGPRLSPSPPMMGSGVSAPTDPCASSSTTGLYFCLTFSTYSSPNGARKSFLVALSAIQDVITTAFFSNKQESARLAQSVERETLNLKAAGSTPALGSIPDAS